jgi:predicted PurR-regulated permease PerM
MNVNLSFKDVLFLFIVSAVVFGAVLIYNDLYQETIHLKQQIIDLQTQNEQLAKLLDDKLEVLYEQNKKHTVLSSLTYSSLGNMALWGFVAGGSILLVVLSIHFTSSFSIKDQFSNLITTSQDLDAIVIEKLGQQNLTLHSFIKDCSNRILENQEILQKRSDLQNKTVLNSLHSISKFLPNPTNIDLSSIAPSGGLSRPK